MALYSFRIYNYDGGIPAASRAFRGDSPQVALEKGLDWLANEIVDPIEDQYGSPRDLSGTTRVAVYRFPHYPRKRPEVLLKGAEFQRALAEYLGPAQAAAVEREAAWRQRRAAKQEEKVAGWEQEGTQTTWEGPLAAKPDLSSLGETASPVMSPVADGPDVER